MIKRSRSSSDSSLEKMHRPQLKLEPLVSNNGLMPSIEQSNSSSSAVPDNNVIKRYRRKSLSSNSGLEEDSPPRATPFPPRSVKAPPAPGRFKLDRLNEDSNQNQKVNTPASAAKKTANAKSATERMKKLMERQLNKQIKADKQNRAIKEEKKVQEQIEWEEHQRSMSDKWAQKSNHRYSNGSASNSDSDTGRTHRNYLNYSKSSFPVTRIRRSSEGSN